MGGLFMSPVRDVAQQLVQPPPPPPPPVVAMPDPKAQEEARKKSIISMTARRASGRAGAIATQGEPIDTLA